MLAAVGVRYTFPRDLSRDYPIAVRGEGIRITDADGRTYIDAASGAISVMSIGYGVRAVADAMAEQAARLPYAFSGEFHHEPGERLAERIARVAPSGLTRSFLVNGGSEAVESAIKLARNYHVVRGDDDRTIVISRRRSYHGATLGTLSVSDVPARKLGYEAYLRANPQVPAPYAYRLGETMPDGTDVFGDPAQLERAIVDCGPERVSAFIAEPIVAAAGPGIMPGPGYYEAVREICDRHGVLFIADEIVTGFGRTGHWFGIEHWACVPDMLVVAKGIAGGYAPLAGVVAHDRIAEAFVATKTPFTHGFTMQAHPVCCAAGVAVMDIIERDGLVAQAARVGAYLHARLQALRADCPIGDVRGVGLLAGVELVADQDSRRPYPIDVQACQRLVDACRNRGLLVYPGVAGDGVAGDAFLVSPPLVTTEHEIDEIVSILHESLQAIALP